MSFKCPLSVLISRGWNLYITKETFSIRLLLTPVYVAPADYQAVTRTITFSSSVSTVSVTVTIFDDSILESTENFVGNLTDPQSQTGISLTPSIANVNITDNDGKLIDFSMIN